MRIGIFGTSWWADAMYLPALREIPELDVVAVCGRDQTKTAAFSERWNIDLGTTNSSELFDHGVDAVIVATDNSSHHDLSMEAMSRGVHVLCEKPLAVTVEQADAMADRAASTGLTTMVPFTYRYMPMNQQLKTLLEQGYVGTPYHLNMRYFAGYGRRREYSWRFDAELAGSGVLGDLASHWLHVARWLCGEVSEIGAISSTFIDRSPRPDGSPYEQAEDSVTITVRFQNGAHGTLQASAVCHEGGDFDQTHHLDLHGSDGTLYALCDWHTVQEVRGVRATEPGPARVLPISDACWGDARRGRVHDTYRDVFRVNGAMVGDFVKAARTRVACEPDFAEGARVQALLDLAATSASLDGRLLRA